MSSDSEKSNKKILIVSSHPDDFEISMGGLFLKLENDVTVVYITSGEYLGEERKEYIKNYYNYYEKLRNKRPTIIFLEQPDNYPDLWDIKECKKKLTDLIKDHDIIYTHFPEDTHRDHRECSRMVIETVRKTKNLIFFESVSAVNFTPNMWVKLKEKELEEKIILLSNYKLDRYYVGDTYIRSKATIDGYECCKNEKFFFAERFCISSMIML